MEGRLENGFLLLVIAVGFLAVGLLRLDKRRRYRGAISLRGEVIDWNKYRGWKGSMARSYYEMIVRTAEGTLTVRTNSGKARKYKKKKDATLLIPELGNPWERLAQYTQNRVTPTQPSAVYYHHPQETGVMLAETVPTGAGIAVMLFFAGLFLFFSVLAFMGAVL